MDQHGARLDRHVRRDVLDDRWASRFPEQPQHVLHGRHHVGAHGHLHARHHAGYVSAQGTQHRAPCSVKVTVELPASLHRDLIAYAEVLARESGQSAADPVRLIVPMLERFIATDRGFAKARKTRS
nr:conserved hypothetical protein [uncultured bacterium]